MQTPPQKKQYVKPTLVEESTLTDGTLQFVSGSAL